MRHMSYDFVFGKAKPMQRRNDVAKYERFVVNEFEHLAFRAAVAPPYDGKTTRHFAEVAE